MNDIIFNKQNGRLGRNQPNRNHVSGLLFYLTAAAILPAGWLIKAVQQIADLKAAETSGIVAGGVTEVAHYHISEFFRINPDAELWVMLAKSDAPDFTEVAALVNTAQGEIRQIGVFTEETFESSQVTALQAKITICENEHKPVIAILSANINDVTELFELENLRTLAAPKVAVVIGQDGGAVGAALYAAKKYSIGCIGVCLATVAKAAVHENIAWVEKFLVSAVELDVPALANGYLISELSNTVLDGINTKGYIFLTKHVGISGSYFNDSHCAVALTNDYAYIENSRTIDKAIRGIRTWLLPKLNSPVQINNDGTIAVPTIKLLENLAGKPLGQMVLEGELSSFTVEIDSAQNVLATSKVIVTVTMVILGVARTIQVDIGF